MKIIYTFSEAQQLFSPYIQTTEFSNSGPWEMSIPALNTTLQYLMEHLHHSSYVLCSDGKKSTLFKLECLTTAPYFKNILEGELNKLNQNKTISEKQKSFIRQTLTDKNKIRILQCIVKKIKEGASVSTEYETFVANMVLPAGVYVLNLTDAIIVNKNGVEPFPVFRGNNPHLPEPFYSANFLPVFSLSGSTNYYDIPIPNYDDVSYSLGLAKYNISQFTTDWSKKTIEKAVFRGGPSGCGYTAETNQRLHLTTFSQNPDLDVGIVSEKGTIDSNSIRFDPIHGLGMMNTGIRSVPRLNYVEQSKYKYIIHVDGNVNAYRLLSVMATGSLVLRVKSNFTSWFDDLIRPMDHYIEVRADLTDLLEKVRWCKTHDTECSVIAERATRFAAELLNDPQSVKDAFVKTVSSVFKILPLKNEKMSKGSREKPPSPLPIQPILEPVKIKPAVNEMEGFYIKGPDDKKCRTGFSQDKKDKTKCVAKLDVKKPAAEKPAAKMNVAISPLVVPSAAVAVAVASAVRLKEPIMNETEDFYIKGPNDKKCKTGFSQDKKDKTKCVGKTRKASPVKRASPPTRKASPVKRESPIVVASPVKRESPIVVASPVKRESPIVVASPVKRASPIVVASPVKRASPIVVASPMKRASPIVVASPMKRAQPTYNEEPNFYIKGPNDKKCKTGFSQDKKDKTKCVGKAIAAKTRKASPPVIRASPVKLALPVIREITPPQKVFSPHSPSYSPPKAPVPLPLKAKPIVKEKEKNSPQKTRKNKKIPDYQEPNQNKILTTTDKIRNKCNSLKQQINDELN